MVFFEIVKLLKEPSKEDKIIIDYARLCGFKWIAVDEDGDVFASVDKPHRCSNNHWESNYYQDNRYGWSYFPIKLSLLTWEDEPYYIGEEE